VITITLSAADATAHIIGNPFVPAAFDHPIVLTLVLLGLLSAVFLKGFREAIGLAVVIVGIYLALNVIVIGWGVNEVVHHPEYFPRWRDALYAEHGSPLLMIGFALLLFPKLALGLSGFETGVAVMPLVKGEPGDDPQHPVGRIENTKKLLRTAALIMTVLLMGSSFATTLLIPPQAFAPGGPANGRALSYLAHEHLGELFGTVYDLSTISILWFAGASAMAGLLNLVPRYLPRYGMAPEWARATRPLVVLFTAITFLITLLFSADVDAQGGAYATGVLVLMTSAAVAVTISTVRRKQRLWSFLFGLITLVFAYTTIVNVIERPDGIKIASFFIGLIILVSLLSRIVRTTELRVDQFEIDDTANRFIDEAAAQGTIRIITNRPEESNEEEYRLEMAEHREDHNLPRRDPILFLEIEVCDASEFAHTMKVEGKDIGGYRVLRAESAAVPNAIAAFLLYLRDRTGKLPHAYFHWGSGNPIAYLFDYVVFGRGDTAPVTREVLRQAEPDEENRPAIHVGGY
jgi:hypothetical protein